MARHLLVRLPLLLLFVLMGTGCTTYKLMDEPGQPARSLANEQNSVVVPMNAAVSDIEMVSSTTLRMRNYAGPRIAASGIERKANARLDGWLEEPGGDQLPQLKMETQISASKERSAQGTMLTYLLSLGILPLIEYMDYTTIMTIEDQGEVLYRHQDTQLVRSALTSMSPIPLFMGQRGGQAFEDAMQASLSNQYQSLMASVGDEQEALANVLRDPDQDSMVVWLEDNPDSIFRSRVLRQLAQMAPVGEEPAWHARHGQTLPDYISRLPPDQQFWAAGPEGGRPYQLWQRHQQGESLDALAAWIRDQSSAYPDFSENQLASLQAVGLRGDVIDALHYQGATRVAERQMQQRQEQTATLVIEGNGGEYMSPYTSDGVTAEWVNRAINADMGASAGSAVGAAAGSYAADRVASSVPFGSMIGGMVGSRAGQAAGREMAIDRTLLRESSDQSFASLQDMAGYLVSRYGNNGNFAEVVNATDQVYPGFRDAVARAVR